MGCKPIHLHPVLNKFKWISIEYEDICHMFNEK